MGILAGSMVMKVDGIKKPGGKGIANLSGRVQRTSENPYTISDQKYVIFRTFFHSYKKG